MKVNLPTNDLALWQAHFMGAKGTLYEGESFTLQLRFSNEYVRISRISRFSRRKSSSSDMCPSTSTSTPTDSSAYPYYMIVHSPSRRMVPSPHCQLHLPIGAVHAQQCPQKNQASQWCRVRETSCWKRTQSFSLELPRWQGLKWLFDRQFNYAINKAQPNPWALAHNHVSILQIGVSDGQK